LGRLPGRLRRRRFAALVGQLPCGFHSVHRSSKCSASAVCGFVCTTYRGHSNAQTRTHTHTHTHGARRRPTDRQRGRQMKRWSRAVPVELFWDRVLSFFRLLELLEATGSSQQVATVLVASSRIADATYRMRLRISTAGKTGYAHVLSPKIAPSRAASGTV